MLPLLLQLQNNNGKTIIVWATFSNTSVVSNLEDLFANYPFNSIDFDGQNQVIINGVASTDQDILKLIGNLNEKKLISQASLASMTLPESNDPTKPKMKGFKVACTVESI